MVDEVRVLSLLVSPVTAQRYYFAKVLKILQETKKGIMKFIHVKSSLSCILSTAFETLFFNAVSAAGEVLFVILLRWMRNSRNLCLQL